MTPTRSWQRDPWNEGCLIGRKCQLKSKDVWTKRVRLQLEERRRDLTLFKSGHRQQAQRLRYAPAEIRRCVCRREGAVSNDGGPEEDRSAGAGRDHRANTHCPRRMVGCSWPRKGPISVSRPLSTTAAPLDCAVCPHRPSMGGVCRPQWVGLRRTHSLRRNEAAQIYKKTGNLRAGAAAVRTHETGKRCPLSRDRVDDALAISEQVKL